MSRKNFYPNNKRSMQESETADYIYDLSRRRSSWITRPLFDAVYTGNEPGSPADKAEAVEAACIAELSAGAYEPQPQPQPEPGLDYSEA